MKFIYNTYVPSKHIHQVAKESFYVSCSKHIFLPPNTYLKMLSKTITSHYHDLAAFSFRTQSIYVIQEEGGGREQLVKIFYSCSTFIHYKWESLTTFFTRSLAAAVPPLTFSARYGLLTRTSFITTMTVLSQWTGSLIIEKVGSY